MRSLAEITMDFALAKAQASNLEELAEQLSKMATDKLDSTLIQIAKDWTGENSQKYLRKGSTLEDKVKNTATNLKNIAALVRTIATNLYNAEMEAYRIAHRR
ncbi:hypothetical protein SAMN05216390_1137 [Lachnospiraceae bacterium KH1T2]|jgi:uncharacterized protein YukE|nr:hypothetical protein SAMN05216390_1137 [Lachnospiraceae bacterium KH1T2]